MPSTRSYVKPIKLPHRFARPDNLDLHVAFLRFADSTTGRTAKAREERICATIQGQPVTEELQSRRGRRRQHFFRTTDLEVFPFLLVGQLNHLVYYHGRMAGVE